MPIRRRHIVYVPMAPHRRRHHTTVHRRRRIYI